MILLKNDIKKWKMHLCATVGTIHGNYKSYMHISHTGFKQQNITHFYHYHTYILASPIKKEAYSIFLIFQTNIFELECYTNFYFKTKAYYWEIQHNIFVKHLVDHQSSAHVTLFIPHTYVILYKYHIFMGWQSTTVFSQLQGLRNFITQKSVL